MRRTTSSVTTKAPTPTAVQRGLQAGQVLGQVRVLSGSGVVVMTT